jgi:hypothetical protein
MYLFFNSIEQKVIDEEKLLDLERRHLETLCLLEATSHHHSLIS